MNQNRLIVVLSGEIASGKSTLAKNLSKVHGFKLLKTRDALIKHASSRINIKNRGALQKFGEKLDKDTKGEWIVKYFQSEINASNRIVIDSIRIIEQVNSLRNAYGHQNVMHIHVHASPDALEKRYFSRNNIKDLNDIEATHKYKTYKANSTEQKVKDLIHEADLVIEAENSSEEDNLVQAASFLRILPSTFTNNVDVLIGGQFGSEGKGQIAGYLAPNYDCLIRVGGPNAGHKVFETPSADTFHIIPSGARRAPNAKIIIGPGAVISEEVILSEIRKYDLEPSRLIIDENATVISEGDKELERALSRIGSTKQGVGGATANNIINRLKSEDTHKAKYVNNFKQFIGNSRSEYEKLFADNKKILLEGTQGTFLSLHHGFYPFVTSRDTTASGCLAEAGISPLRVRKIIMVTRRYPIRVQSPNNGTSGPFTKSEFGQYQIDKKTSFPSEITFEEIANRSEHKEDLVALEKTTTTKLNRRVAEFSWSLFREASEINSPTDIALTFADYISYSNRLSRRYDQLSTKTKKFIEELERCSGVNVSLIATGFKHRSVIDRRNWI